MSLNGTGLRRRQPTPARPPIPADVRRCGHLDYELGKDWVYAYYDRDGELLYVGLSNDAAYRANAHRSQSKWWRFVADGEAVLADLHRSGCIEAELIVLFDPIFNVVHSRVSAQLVIEYCARREAWDLVDHYLDIYGFDDHDTPGRP